ncbi:MAG: response regulator, partial [Planctomycetes bacterium]|nr:response regulator [Planctomycetota bacterium]
LVLMDLQMPEMDGIAATKAIRAAGIDVPIVSLTAHALADDRARCLAAGADAYETKPITRQRLAEVVATHAARVARRA